MGFGRSVSSQARHLCLALFVCLWLPVSGNVATPAHGIGFAAISIPTDGEQPLEGGVWYPTDTLTLQPNASQSQPESARLLPRDTPVSGSRLPLIVLSHGGGGSWEGHEDTARALARAGFVAAAISHRGDTYDDQSQVLKLWRRPQQLSRLIDFMLMSWPARAHLDPRRVGAFGFSNGGFSVLVLAGGTPNLQRIAPYCQEHPTHDLCAALSAAGIRLPDGIPVPPNPWHADARVKAVVAAAPAFGFTFDRFALSQVRVPVQLWGGENDQHQPRPWYEDAVRAALAQPPDFHRVAGAGHYAFLPPCDSRLASHAPEICTDARGFDRAAFHQQFNAAVVRFFTKTLE